MLLDVHHQISNAHLCLNHRKKFLLFALNQQICLAADFVPSCVNTDWWATQEKEVIWGFFWSLCPSVPASVPTCWRIIRSFTLIISTLESDPASAGTANDHPTFLLPSFFLPVQFQNGLTDSHPSENAPGERTQAAQWDSSWRQIVCVGAVMTEGNDLLKPVVAPVLCRSSVPMAGISSFSMSLSLGNNGATL